jgi:hypothetical protein
MAKRNFDIAAWVNSDPDALPSKGQVFALLMPSKGGLSTGGLRATEAKEKLEAMGLNCWTRKGLNDINTAIRRNAERRAAGQAWLDGLLGAAEAPVSEVPKAEAPVKGSSDEVLRLRAEVARLREGGGAPEDIPEGMSFVRGHLRRARG